MAGSAIESAPPSRCWRAGDLPGRACRVGHRSAHGPAVHGSVGAGTGRWHHERRDLCLCRPGLQPDPAAQDVHLYLHGLGAAIVCRSTGCSVADEPFELALGVLGRHSFDALRRHHGAAEPVTADALPSAKQCRCPEARTLWLPGSSPSLPPPCNWQVSGWTGWRWACSLAAWGACDRTSSVDATGLHEVPPRPVAGHPDPRSRPAPSSVARPSCP